MDAYLPHTEVVRFESSSRSCFEFHYGYDRRKFGHQRFDPITFMLTIDGKVSCQEDIVFWGNEHGRDDAVIDLCTWPNNAIEVDFEKMPKDITSVVITVPIYNEDAPFDFSQVDDVSLCIYDLFLEGPVLLKREYELDLGSHLTYLMWEIKRIDSGWAFCTLGDAFEGKLEDLCVRFGIDPGQ